MDLEVQGLHALLFDDDSNAKFVNSREALVVWNGDSSLLIDRYDARHLLDRIPPRPVTCARRLRLLDDACDAELLAEIDGERFRDLADGEDGERVEIDLETGEKSDATGSGAYQAVPFSYRDPNMPSIPENTEYNSGFRPPFEVPEFLINHLPPTEKLHQIMARTAIFVSEHGGQSEIVLRVKQGNNPTFGFLMPDHQLHAYFQYLVDHPQILKHHTDSPKMEEDMSNIPTFETGALSLLGSLYGNGDDDDASNRTEIKETEHHNLVSAGNVSSPMKAENDEPPSTAVLENEGAIKLPPSTCTKAKPLLVNKATAIAASKKTGDGLSLAKDMQQSCHKDTADVKSVLEPPTFLKRTIEKIIEFLVRNGKQFETILIEQDRSIGRFPFLLSTNQYHSYYLKILEKAQEMKMQGKNLFHDRNDAEHHGGNKKKVESHGNDAKADDRDLAELSEGAYYDPQRKEKFKMVLGGQKKDSQDQQPKVAKHSGLSADEAAAIVLAATRGVSPANSLPKKSPDNGGGHSSKNNGATADEAAAIVMAVTRGRSPANAPQNMPKDNRRTSSSGTVQTIKPISKLTSNSTSGISMPAGLSGSIAQSDNSSCHKTSSDVAVATVIAKSVALAASSEADSAEAGLTKEQKLKAERLKRAKMFAALIQNGSSSLGELVNSASNRGGSMEPSNGGSMRLDTDSKTVGIEREGSSVPFDAEVILDREHESRKRHHSRYRGHHDDSDEDHAHTRKKHRSSKEDERRHKRSSEHRHRHRHRLRDLSSSDDEDRERSKQHRRKHHSHLNRKSESKAGDTLNPIEHEHSEGPSVSSTGVSAGRDISVPDDKQISDATEIPNDLRAKIRAMLLETL